MKAMKKNNIIEDWLNENGSLEIEMLVKRNLAIAKKVRDILNDRKARNKGYLQPLLCLMKWRFNEAQR